jgi:hypothetical protein
MRKPNHERHRVDYYCDRCGRKFADSRPGEKPSADDTSAQRGVTLTLPVLDDKSLSFRTMDLCGKCVVGLCRWLDKYKKGRTK